jgi:hypothetical protein
MFSLLNCQYHFGDAENYSIVSQPETRELSVFNSVDKKVIFLQLYTNGNFIDIKLENSSFVKMLTLT